MADEIYLEPLTAETIRRIIEKERPDSLLAGLGGQTGLTLSMQLLPRGLPRAHGRAAAGRQRGGHRQAPRTASCSRRPWRASASRVIPSDIGLRRGGRRSPLPRRSAIRSSCVRRSRWAARAAAWPTTPRNFVEVAAGGLGACPIHPGADREVHLRLEGDRVRGHARRRGQRHRRLLAWRTSTRWACTPATPSSSPRRSRWPTSEYQMLRTRAL